MIARWLGHESPKTTQIYLHADPRMKEEALTRTSPNGIGLKRCHPSDGLLAYLDQL